MGSRSGASSKAAWLTRGTRFRAAFPAAGAGHGIDPWPGGPRGSLCWEISLPRGVVRGRRLRVRHGLPRRSCGLRRFSHRSSSSGSGGGVGHDVHASAIHRMHPGSICRSRRSCLAHESLHGANCVVREDADARADDGLPVRSNEERDAHVPVRGSCGDVRAHRLRGLLDCPPGSAKRSSRRSSSRCSGSSSCPSRR